MDTLDPIMSLRSDHDVVRGVLNNLDGYLKKIGAASSDGLRKNLVGQLAEITAFIDKDLEIHFKKEEDALFPVLGNYVGIETGPIHVMLIEHKNSRDLSDNFKKSIKDYQESDAYKDMISAGDAFVALLSEHIDKEDNILFNMAEMQLSTDEKESIMEKMRNIK